MKPVLTTFLLAWVATGCGGNDAPASTAHRTDESKPPIPPATRDDLGTVVLSGEAVAALGVEVTAVVSVGAGRSFVTGGSVEVPAGRDAVLAAPASGRIAPAARSFPRPGETVKAGQPLFSLVPIASVDRDVRARATRELEVARADQQLAEARLARAEVMLADRSGSQRSLDEAKAQQQTTAASVKEAEARLRTLTGGSLDSDVALSIRSPIDGIVRGVRVTAGQSVPQGAALMEISGAGRWVRASFAGRDALSAESIRDVHAYRFGASERVVLTPVLSPPSADPGRATVDRFFVLPTDADWIPGERVAVEVVTSEPHTWLAVPHTSVVRDAEGGAWIYEQLHAGTYRRRRVLPVRLQGDQILLAAGPPAGTAVVSVGVPEIWGFDLGADR